MEIFKINQLEIESEAHMYMYKLDWGRFALC